MKGEKSRGVRRGKKVRAQTQKETEWKREMKNRLGREMGDEKYVSDTNGLTIIFLREFETRGRE